MFVLNLDRNSARAGGQFSGMGTPFAPTPVPDLMVKAGTREGSRFVGSLLLLLLLLLGVFVLAGGIFVVGEPAAGLLLGWLVFCGEFPFVGVPTFVPGRPGRPLCLPGKALTLRQRNKTIVEAVEKRILIFGCRDLRKEGMICR